MSGVCEFVEAVLQMYTSLLLSYERLDNDEKEKIEIESIYFYGFDGNNENEFYICAKKLFEESNKYEALKEYWKSSNSHGRRYWIYSRMLEKWRRIKRAGFDKLTIDQIIEIVK